MTHIDRIPGDYLAPFRDLIGEWLAGRSPYTLRAYSSDLAALGKFLGTKGHAATAFELVKSQHHANRVLIGWRGSMVDAGRSPSTINRRLSAARSLIKLARMLGFISWAVDVSGLPVEPYRDTRGIPWEAYQGALAAASTRDRAILRLCGDRGLRRGEVVSLNREDLNADCSVVEVVRKGKRGQRIKLTLADETAAAVRAWLEERGEHRGALFPGKFRGSRLSVSQVYRIAKKVTGTRPHGLRHTAITHALNVTDGDVRAVRAFSGHVKVETLMKYDDNRRDMGGDVARRMHL